MTPIKASSRKLALTAISLIVISAMYVLFPKLIAWSIWSKHEKAVEDVAQNRPSSLHDFQVAVHFMSELTGIETRADPQYAGYVPTAHTADDLNLWRDWYKSNWRRIYWDFSAKKVLVKK